MASRCRSYFTKKSLSRSFMARKAFFFFFSLFLYFIIIFLPLFI